MVFSLLITQRETLALPRVWLRPDYRQVFRHNDEELSCRQVLHWWTPDNLQPSLYAILYISSAYSMMGDTDAAWLCADAAKLVAAAVSDLLSRQASLALVRTSVCLSWAESIGFSVWVFI